MDQSATEKIPSIKAIGDGVNTQKASALTQAEREVLLQLIQEENNCIVNDKRTNPGIILKKQKAWNTIEMQFNSTPDMSLRTSKQLKRCWENSKQRAKAEVAEVNRQKKKTGGGPAESELSAQTSLICSIIPSQMKPLENCFDSDEAESRKNVIIDNSEEQSSISNGEEKKSNPVIPVQCDELSNRRSVIVAQTQTTDEKKKKQSYDKRSFVVQLEEEEHKINMMILKRKLENEELQIQKSKRSAELMEIEAQKRITLLDLQISSHGNTSTVYIEGNNFIT